MLLSGLSYMPFISRLNKTPALLRPLAYTHCHMGYDFLTYLPPTPEGHCLYFLHIRGSPFQLSLKVRGGKTAIPLVIRLGETLRKQMRKPTRGSICPYEEEFSSGAHSQALQSLKNDEPKKTSSMKSFNENAISGTATEVNRTPLSFIVFSTATL